MAPKWRTLLAKHQGKTLGEFCRRPKIQERIAGFIVGFSADLIVVHRLDWNTFTLDGYSILRNRDIKQSRFFSKDSYWQAKAVKAIKLRPRRISKLKVTDWSETLGAIADQFPLIHIERELKYPGECWIGAPLELTSRDTVIENLDPDAEWTGPYGVKTRDITRVDFGGGYERALEMTAPKPFPPAGEIRRGLAALEMQRIREPKRN